MNFSIENEWGVAVTLIALVMIVGIFGSALWFIFSAARTNRKFRWLQILDRRKRKQDQQGSGTNRQGDPLQ